MPKSIGEILESFFAGRLQDRAPLEAHIQDTWLRLMGPEIASLTRRIVIRGKVCIIYISDPVVREELHFQSHSILEALRGGGFTQLQKVEIRGG